MRAVSLYGHDVKEDKVKVNSGYAAQSTHAPCSSVIHECAVFYKELCYGVTFLDRPAQYE